MKLSRMGTESRFVSESPEEIQLIGGGKSIPLQELIVSIRDIGMLSEYKGEFNVSMDDYGFVVNNLKKERVKFDIVLRAPHRSLPFEKLKDCYVSESNPQTFYHKFHCNGGIQ